MLLHLSKLHLHRLESRLLLKQGLLHRVLLLLLLPLLLVELLLENLHLLPVLLFNLLALLVVSLRSSKILPLVLLHLAHLSLDLFDPLCPGILQKFAKVRLDLINVLLDRMKYLLLFLQAGSSTGLFNRLFCNLIALSSCWFSIVLM